MIVVGREDLSPAYQSVQTGHALALFCIEHNDIANSWHQNSQFLSYLSVKDESKLLFLIEKAHLRGITISIFREPDINNQITAIAMEPTDKSKRLCSGLPCVLKEFNSVGLNKDNYVNAESLVMPGG